MFTSIAQLRTPGRSFSAAALFHFLPLYFSSLLLLGVLSGCGGGGGSGGSPAIAAVDCASPAPVATPVKNPITIENSKPGTTAWRITHQAAYHELEGYASLTSVNRGGRISFFVNTIAPAYTLQVFRLGWYGGLGARSVTSPVTLPGVAQPIPTPDPTTGLAECVWTQPYVLTTSNPGDPSDWVSGVYLVKLTAQPSGRESYIIFVVRDDGRSSDLLFQSSVATEQAYNPWGGKSLYVGHIGGPYSLDKAVKVSFNRPYYDGSGAGEFFIYGEYTTLRFLEREGYDVTYSTDVDTHENAANLLKHRGFLSAGHDEYWSYEMRLNVTNALAQGVNLGFFSSNTMYWQIRFEPGFDGSRDRTVVCYKVGAHVGGGVVPDDDPVALNSDTFYLLTTLWRSSHVTLPGFPEEELLGEESGIDEQGPAVPAALANHDIIVVNTSNWVFNKTGLHDGDHLAGLLGGETEVRHGIQPRGTVSLAESPLAIAGPISIEQEMTEYQALSCATVFSTGDWDWASGVDSWFTDAIGAPSLVSPAVQRITRNVLTRLISPPPKPAGQ